MTPKKNFIRHRTYTESDWSMIKPGNHENSSFFEFFVDFENSIMNIFEYFFEIWFWILRNYFAAWLPTTVFNIF